MSFLNDSKTRLLLRPSGAPGSSLLTDLSIGGNPKTVVCHGVMSTAQTKFGDVSVRCYGMDGGARVYSASDFQLGMSKWTLEGWFYAVGPPFPFTFYYDDQNYLSVTLANLAGNTASYRIEHMLGGARIVYGDPGSVANAIGAWHHFSLIAYAVFAGKVAMVFNVDGDPVCGGFGNPPSNFGSYTLYIGAGMRQGFSGLQYLDGYVDEVRLQGEALYVPSKWPPGAGEGFTPAVAAYPAEVMQVAYGANRRRAIVKQVGLGFTAIGLDPFKHVAYGVGMRRRPIEQIGFGTHHRRGPVEQVGHGTLFIGTEAPAVAYQRRQMAFGYQHRRGPVEHVGHGYNHLHGTDFEYNAYGRGKIWRAYKQIGFGHNRRERVVYQIGFGGNRIKDSDDPYWLYHGLNGSPDFEAAPYGTYATLPITIPSITGQGVHHWVLRYFDAAGMTSQNIVEFVFELDGSDDFIYPYPALPREVCVSQAAGTEVLVKALYPVADDLRNGSDAFADKWQIYYTTDGSDPDPDLDTPVEVDIVWAGTYAILAHTLTGIGDGVTVKVIVAVKRTDDGRKTCSSIVSLVTDDGGPAAPVAKVFHRVGAKRMEVA